MKTYLEIPDVAMPFVLQEFQRTLDDSGYRLETDIPHQTPQEMRDCLAKMHGCWGKSKLHR